MKVFTLINYVQLIQESFLKYLNGAKPNWTDWERPRAGAMKKAQIRAPWKLTILLNREIYYSKI